MLVEKISRETGVGLDRLTHFAETASRRYFTYFIEKKTGGLRFIAHPARPLKFLQRYIVNNALRYLPVHSAAQAYKQGSSIRKNARQHLNTAFTLRVDFEDFFHSFKSRGIASFLGDSALVGERLDGADIRIVVQLLTRLGQLSIGAPSSPVITNAMMFGIDKNLHEFCFSKGLVYTRYADDIFISGNEVKSLQEAFGYLRNCVDTFSYANLTINERKTSYLSRRYRRQITGLIITSDNRISIGRDRKREIRSLVHKFITGSISAQDIGRARGLVAFASDAEPTFHRSLISKYGVDAVQALMTAERSEGLFSPLA